MLVLCEFAAPSERVLTALGYPAGTSSFLKRMLASNPTDRPTFAEAVMWWTKPRDVRGRVSSGFFLSTLGWVSVALYLSVTLPLYLVLSPLSLPHTRSHGHTLSSLHRPVFQRVLFIENPSVDWASVLVLRPNICDSTWN